MSRTSVTHPLQIAEVEGKVYRADRTAGWDMCEA